MAKKRTSITLSELISVIGIIATATCLLLSKLGLGGGLLNQIAYLCLLISAFMASIGVLKRASTVFKIIYIVSLILVIVFIFIPQIA